MLNISILHFFALTATPESSDQPADVKTTDSPIENPQEGETAETTSNKEEAKEIKDKETTSENEEKKEEAKPEAYDQHGDPEMAPAYLKHLLPIFAHVYQTTMLPTVK